MCVYQYKDLFFVNLRPCTGLLCNKPSLSKTYSLELVDVSTPNTCLSFMYIFYPSHTYYCCVHMHSTYVCTVHMYVRFNHRYYNLLFKVDHQFLTS